MNPNYKTALYADLSKKTVAVKIHKDLNEYIGGLVQGLAICNWEKNKTPITFNIGPLSGIFPFVSKTACVYLTTDGKIKESYGGGRMALAMKMAGIDLLVITGTSKKPLGLLIKNTEASFVELTNKTRVESFKKEGFSGRRSLLSFANRVYIDSYFGFSDSVLATEAQMRGLMAISLSGTNSYKINNPEYYERIYFDILSKPQDLAVPFMGFKSCGGCPAGCRYASSGEKGTESAVLPKCLVSCEFANQIYKNVPRVFSCLESVGYHYNHTDLENISEIAGNLKRQLA